MCCIPLTSQRISQLVTVVSTTAAAAQAAMLPIQRLLRTLGAYAAVNKSTAEELQQTPETASMVRDPLLCYLNMCATGAEADTHSSGGL